MMDRTIASMFVTENYTDCAVAPVDRSPMTSAGMLKQNQPVWRRIKRNRFYENDLPTGENESKGLPERYIETALAWILDASENQVRQIVIGCFGPFVSLDEYQKDAADSGYGMLPNITSHPEWVGKNIYQMARAFLTEKGSSAKVIIKTEVDLAAYGEFWHRIRKGIERKQLGNPRIGGKPISDKHLIDNSVHVFLKISRSINGGIVYGGDIWKGRLHPLMSVVKPRRFFMDPPGGGDRILDEFPGCCPVHASCIEGLIGVQALEERTGMPFEEIPSNDHLWSIVGYYIARMCVMITGIIAPSLIVLGGRVIADPRTSAANKTLMDSVYAYFLREITSQTMDRTSPQYPELSRQGGYLQLAEDQKAGLHGGLILAANEPINSNQITPLSQPKPRSRKRS